MPKSQVDRIASSAGGTALERAEGMAEALKVSVLAAGVRLRTLDLISDEDLESIRLESDRRWEESRRKRGGGPDPWRIRYRDLGSGYVGVVARALEDERVDLLDASYLMNARIPMAKQMIDEYHRTERLE